MLIRDKTRKQGTMDSNEVYIEDYGAYQSYMDWIKDLPRIDHEREKELSKIILHSKDEEAVAKAKEELVNANLLLVVKQAQRYKNKNSRFTLGLMDIIEEGNLALMDAAEKYDGTKGVKFSTFAVLLIRHKITRAINNSHIIRTPVDHHRVRHEINKLKWRYGEENLDDEIIKDELDINQGYLNKTRECRVIYLENMNNQNEEGEERGWEDTFSGEEDKSVESKSLLEYLRQEMRETLTPREYDVLYYYYFDSNFDNLAEIGKKVGVSRERIRQIATCATKKLRNKMLKKWNEEHKDDKFSHKVLSKARSHSRRFLSPVKEASIYEEGTRSKMHRIIKELSIVE
jgi:RNA polymerase primary sigma factor